MRLIIFSFTEVGSKLNARINRLLSQEGVLCESYTMKCFSGSSLLKVMDENLQEWIGSNWGRASFLFIGATGIAIRYIAPWIQDKYTDSAVLSMDEKARFIIPLLSGHIGGAVSLAKKISACTQAEPVITTSTDIQGKFAVDVFATMNNLYITNRQLAKKISAAILNQQSIGIYSPYTISGNIPEELKVCNCMDELNKYPYGIVIEDEKSEKRANVLCLLSRRLVVGIGCRRRISEAVLESQLLSLCREKGWYKEQIVAFASIDIKMNEKGIIELAERYQVPFITYTAHELSTIEGVGETSAFVKQVTGVDNVCERAARTYCPKGELVLPKRKMDKVTFAVVKQKINEIVLE